MPDLHSSLSQGAYGWDMRVLFLFVCLIGLVACNTAGPHFRGLPATRITVAGSVFDVRVNGDLAEALRVNPEYAPRFGPIRQRAAFAMAAVSGCEVEDVLGDQALATGRLDCRERHAPVMDVAGCRIVIGPSRNARVPERVGALCEKPRLRPG